MSETRLPLVALRGLVLFPGALAPIVLSHADDLHALAEHLDSNLDLVLVTLREGQDLGGIEDLYEVGVRGHALRTLDVGDGRTRALFEGDRRVRLRDLRREPEGGWTTRVEPLVEAAVDPAATWAGERLLREALTELLGRDQRRPGELADAPPHPDEGPGRLADYAAGMLELPLALQQRLLEEPSLDRRLAVLALEAAKARELVQLSNSIRKRVKTSIDREQRHWFLREQIRVAREELGEGGVSELDRLERKLEFAGLPRETWEEAQRELSRLRSLRPDGAEYGIARQWLDWLGSLPWDITTVDDQDLGHARAFLDAEHHALGEAKQRVLEYLAVRQLNPRARGLILCLVGPPGVGKTSLAQAVAQALGRSWERVALGGVKDESEIRGHRRTYVGAMPGRILQAIRRAGTRNPVLVLDEIDKLQAVSGDPAAALLEVLDPSQNRAFRDHYLDAPFDLSEVLFVATANLEDGIPSPLLDRLELVRLSGYVDEEKLQIARQHLLPGLRHEHGLDEEKVELSTDALRAVVRDYTREPGVRELERQLRRIHRVMALRFVEGRRRKLVIKAHHLEDLLGPQPYRVAPALEDPRPGVALGLAWTPSGGEVLFVEAASVPGKGELLLTGSMGQVMRESVQAARTLLQGRAEGLGIPARCFSERDLHVHLPAAGIPKDGPSAGVAVLAAMASQLRGQPLRTGVALTGELTLRGRVLPVGGIKEKLLAAARAGLSRVVLPAANEPDARGLKLGGLELVYVREVDEALDAAL
jgi:ATP-dependent Lon protease